MTNFISDQKQAKNRGGVKRRTTGEGVGWEQGGDPANSQQLPLTSEYGFFSS